jgi:hypothetical protein
LLYHISIHHPRPEHERDLIASMHRFGNAARQEPGLRDVHTLKDGRSGALVGLAVWESADALTAARSALAAAVEHDDFDTWESEPVQVFLLEEV